MGGQTALNLAIQCEEMGIWEEYNVRMIGVDTKAIDITRTGRPSKLMGEIDANGAPSHGQEFLGRERGGAAIWVPFVHWASYTLGGAGAAVVYDKDAFEDNCSVDCT